MILYIMVVSLVPTVFNQLHNELVDSAQIAEAFGCVELVLLFVALYWTGRGWSDTLWGLAYFDRLKLMFDGLGVVATYFVGFMSFAAHALSEYDSAIKGWARARLLFLE